MADEVRAKAEAQLDGLVQVLAQQVRIDWTTGRTDVPRLGYVPRDRGRADASRRRKWRDPAPRAAGRRTGGAVPFDIKQVNNPETQEGWTWTLG
jgi:hypothetical protein